MAFFNKIVRALGFGGDIELDYDQDVNEVPNQNGGSIMAHESQNGSYQPSESAISIEIGIDDEHVNLIFGKVVEVFNDALPSFLGQSVDAEKQKQLLYQSLDDSLKDYLMQVQRQAHEKCQADWAAEREKLQADTDELRRHAAELEEKKSQLKDRQLSADRQKRALAERVKDLEEQVMRLEAEKEQLDIENKCMLNKAKAAAVLEAQLEGLQAEGANSMADALKLQETIQAKDAEIEKLKKEVADGKKSREDINDAMLSEFKKQAAEATQELKAIRERHSEDEQKFQLQEAQIEDLRNSLEAYKAQISEKDSQLAEKDSQLAEISTKVKEKEALLSEKDTELEQKNALLTEKEAQLDECISQEELDTIMAQVEKFEEVRAKMDAHIEKLRESLQKAKDENKSLRESIKYHLEDKMRLEREIQTLNNLEDESQTTPESEGEMMTKKKQPRKSKRTSSSLGDMDDLISGEDWLVSIPDEESPMRAKDSSETFGYQAPQRKRPVDNDAQLSLFDI